MSEALWTPSPERVIKANMTEFLRYVEERGGPPVPDYSADSYWQLHEWSINNPGALLVIGVAVLRHCRSPRHRRRRRARRRWSGSHGAARSGARTEMVSRRQPQLRRESPALYRRRAGAVVVERRGPPAYPYLPGAARGRGHSRSRSSRRRRRARRPGSRLAAQHSGSGDRHARRRHRSARSGRRALPISAPRV